MKLIVAGGREFDDYELLERELNKLLKNEENVEIVCGRARGADDLGDTYAINKGIPVKYFPADWNKGPNAGYMRNSDMASYADSLIAFWNGSSRGTKHMINYATKKGLKVTVIKY